MKKSNSEVEKILAKQSDCEHKYEKNGTTPFRMCEKCGAVK